MFSLLLLIFANIEPSIQNEGRGFVFPPATVLQFAMGLAIPAQVPNRNIATNLGLISNIPLPSTISQLYPYVGHTRHFTHNVFYRIVEKIYTSHDMNGKQCVLKTICQTSSLKLDKQLLSHRLLEYLFVPSRAGNVIADDRYKNAEKIANQTNRNCNDEFNLCSTSLIDLITE